MPVDTIADFLTRIRNGLAAKHRTVDVPASKMKMAIASILRDQGYIKEFEKLDGDNQQGIIRVQLRYSNGQPSIKEITRISKPGRRVYTPASEIPRVRNGLGIAIVSTSKGVVTDKHARSLNVGGEIICTIW
jgi:small subunit ribosomal protein S8